MGDNHVHFLGGNPLNRVSWLRTSTPFLHAALTDSRSQWVLFNEGQPLVSIPPKSHERPFAYLTLDDVKPILGPAPYFGQGKQEGESTTHLGEEYKKVLEAARIYGPGVVFLGLLEPSGNSTPSTSLLISSSIFENQAANTALPGIPYFSLDVSQVPPEEISKVLESAAGRVGGGVTFAWEEPRSAIRTFEKNDAAIFAEARSMVDWNARNKFCPACGSKVYSLWGGWKLSCSTLLPWAENNGRAPCPTIRGLHNFMHPRTDIAVIVGIIDETGDKILLGRNKKFPGKMYSTLAGFIEPGESLEEAVTREIYEESGVVVSSVRYHSCQPWPYPANLMVGAYAHVKGDQVIRIDLDNELADARWFTRSEILAVLAHPEGTLITRRQFKRFDEVEGALAPAEGTKNATVTGGASSAPVEEVDEELKALQPPPFVVPPLTAIAGVLISEWAHGKGSKL